MRIIRGQAAESCKVMAYQLHFDQPNVSYCTLNVSLRPPRVALLYHSSSSWQFFARQAMRLLSSLWGGIGDVAIPAGNGEAISDSLLPFLRAYDPDYIAVHEVTLDELSEVDPDVISRVISENFGEIDPTESQIEQARRTRAAFDVSEAVAKTIDTWCSPIVGTRAQDCEFFKRHIRPLALTTSDLDYSGLIWLTKAPGDTVCNIVFEEDDPLVQLMVETRFGYLHAGQVPVGQTR